MATAKGEKDPISSGSSDHEKGVPDVQKRDDIYDVDTNNTRRLAAVFENPLEGIPHDQLMADVTKFCEENDLMDHLDSMKKGALVSQQPYNYMNIAELTPDEKNALEREHTHKWSQPFMLYWLVGT